MVHYFVLASVTIHKSLGSLYLEALSAQFGQSPIVMSSHGTLPSITTDAPGLIPRTFLFLQHRDSHPGLPRKQTDKAVVINFFLSNKKTWRWSHYSGHFPYWHSRLGPEIMSSYLHTWRGVMDHNCFRNDDSIYFYPRTLARECQVLRTDISDWIALWRA